MDTVIAFTFQQIYEKVCKIYSFPLFGSVSLSRHVFVFLSKFTLYLPFSLSLCLSIVSLGLGFRDRLEWDQVFRLELVLGNGTRVVCFLLETWVLFVLSVVQFTIFLICESLIHGGSDGKASARNVGPWFDPWDGKIPWRRKWQLTPGFLPGESHRWRSLVGYSPWGRKELDVTSLSLSLSKYRLRVR